MKPKHSKSNQTHLNTLPNYIPSRQNPYTLNPYTPKYSTNLTKKEHQFHPKPKYS